MVFLNGLTIEELEAAKSVSNFLFIVVTLGVWLGVVLENETFSKATQNHGWKLLVACLGAETFFAALLWQMDSDISRRQKDEIISLENRIAPRRLTTAQCKDIGGSLGPLAGRKARVATYALDAEGSTLGLQIVVCLRAAGIDTESGMASIIPLGGFGSGVFVSGSDAEMVEALRTSLGSRAGLIMSSGSGIFQGNIGNGNDSPSTKSALVVVGVKPVEMPAFK